MTRPRVRVYGGPHDGLVLEEDPGFPELKIVWPLSQFAFVAADAPPAEPVRFVKYERRQRMGCVFYLLLGWDWGRP